jgi:hypothetical protein
MSQCFARRRMSCASKMTACYCNEIVIWDDRVSWEVLWNILSVPLFVTWLLCRDTCHLRELQGDTQET